MITDLTNTEDVTVSSHQQKERILWDEFRPRLGITEFRSFTIQPSALINQDIQLQHLEEPFTVDEIDNIIKSPPSNKSPSLMASTMNLQK